MNRHYTKEGYIDLVERIRSAVPDIALTTDIIVGFPGETEADFEDTLDLVRKVRFDSAFTFLYSVRTGTPAAEYEDQIPEEVKADRRDAVMELQQEIAFEAAEQMVGKEPKKMPFIRTARWRFWWKGKAPGAKPAPGQEGPIPSSWLILTVTGILQDSL